mgnify:CR=1 FL=1
MNTDELIVMGVLMILAGGLMVARHFINNIPTDRPHSLPMATRKALAVGDQQMDQMLERIAKLEEQLQFIEDRRAGKLERRIAKLED